MCVCRISTHLIVNEFNVLPANVLSVILLLLKLEDVLHEELLQVLVCVVDAELLKGVNGEVLKSENVQHSNG